MTPGPAPRSSSREGRLVWAAVLLAAVTFDADLFLPLGVAGGAPYTVLMLLGLWSERPRFILVLAVASTILTILGALLSPPGAVLWVGMLNRSLTLAAVWAITFFLLRYLRTRRALRRSEEEAQAYLEVAEIAFVVLDREGIVRLINRKGCEILGYEEGDVLGKNWFQSFLPERVAGKLEKGFRELMSEEVGPSEYFESPVMTLDGRERLVAWHNTVLRDEKGRITGTLSAGEDVTERRNAEEEHQRRESLARIGQMAAVVAHELRNPIAGIAGAVQVIGSRLSPGSKEREVVSDILKRLDSLKLMSHDLLQFARPREPRFEKVEIRPLLQSTGNLLADEPELGKIRVKISGPDLSLQGDPEFLRILFLNLMLNAAHAMEGKGKIDLSLHNGGDHCRIEVKDDGPGIPADIRGQIFEPFFTTKHKGTGLGLAIARNVVEAHGGRIFVDCPEGGGTTILVTLPKSKGKRIP